MARQAAADGVDGDVGAGRVGGADVMMPRPEIGGLADLAGLILPGALPAVE